MSANSVKTTNFEGPFDLLLRLVTSKKVDIAAISINEIADQYLSEVSKMIMLDLETASDFIVVASTLLEIKAHYLLPKTSDSLVKEVESLSPIQAREFLIERLIRYKQFKNAAIKFSEMAFEESKFHSRLSGPTSDFKDWVPDFLRDVGLSDITKSAYRVLSKTDQYILSSNHIAAKPIPVEVYVNSILSSIKVQKDIQFSSLVENAKTRDIVVVSFLAVLELVKRELVSIDQQTEFGDIDIHFLQDGVVEKEEMDERLIEKAEEVL